MTYLSYDVAHHLILAVINEKEFVGVACVLEHRFGGAFEPMHMHPLLADAMIRQTLNG
jgi:hypothetical protein